LLDVSETGVRLIVGQEFPPASEIEISMTGHGLKGTVKRLANIRWQLKLDNGKFCIGAEFQKRIAYNDWQNIAALT
jgi:hypothetical protein